MIDPVREAYDASAERYAALFLDDLDRDAQSVRWLTLFAETAAERRGQVVDLGCGPGSVVRFLSEFGLTVTGVDLSPGQVAQAKRAFPNLAFEVGDLTMLDFADSSVGGIVARHSLIHLPPSRLDDVFVKWFRASEPGAPIFVSFFGSRSADAHGTPFDHKVVTAYELFPAEIGRLIAGAGFTDVQVEAIPIPDGGRPFDHTTILARKPMPDLACSYPEEMAHDVRSHVGPECPDLGDLEAAARDERHPFVERTRQEWLAGINRFDREGEAFFVAVSHGRTVGMCGLNVDPYLDDDGVGRLRHLYVDPAWRRIGIAGELVGRCLAIADGRFDRVRLRTSNPAAGALYRSWGFIEVDEATATHEFRTWPFTASARERT